jgi:DNA-3-methyladenine glycosylase
MQDTSAPASARPKVKPIRPLSRAELPLDPTELARFLIGKTLVHDVNDVRLSGRIVETEAYLVGDAASHAFRGRTGRNGAMFLPRGHAYVYISYGCWPMLNVSAGEEGVGTAVLLRALEPLEGIDAMRAHRATDRLLDIARGPGRLAGAMRVTMAHDSIDLCGSAPLWLGTSTRPTHAIVTTTRIGITKDAERPLRFLEAENPFASGPRRLNGL